MAKLAAAAAPFLAASFVLLLFLSTFGETANAPQAQKTWCVANPLSSDKTLQENLDFACSKVDCTVLKEGGPCYNPDNPMAHASVAMNLYYQAKGASTFSCYFYRSGLIVVTDPSYATCRFA